MHFLNKDFRNYYQSFFVKFIACLQSIISLKFMMYYINKFFYFFKYKLIKHSIINRVPGFLDNIIGHGDQLDCNLLNKVL